ncbi:MAG TPA: ATP-binding protein [Anaerolineae bacterium]|nr:ATP-binding protein [Anaerolineae bacterium]
MPTGLSLYRLITGQYQDYITVNTVSMMRTISFQIENVIMDNSLPVDFYAGFQKYSAFMRQKERYERLAQVARRVFIFGIPDVEVPVIPGIEFIPLTPDDNLALEWFLVVNAPYFYTSLLTRETDERDEVTGERQFAGMWTHDQQVVDQAYLLTTQYLNQDYNPIHQRDYARQNEYIVDIASNLVLNLEKSKLNSRRNQRLSTALQKIADAASQEIAYDQFLDQAVTDLQEIFKARTVTIWQPDPQADEIELTAAAGLPKNWRRALYRRQPKDNPDLLVTQTLQNNKIAHIADTEAAEIADLFDPAVRSMVALPLQARGQLLGALQITSHKPNVYADENLDSLATIGTQLALAMSGIAPETPAPPPPDNNAANNLTTILDSTLDGIIVLEADKSIRFVNNMSRHLFQLPPHRLAGESFAIFNNSDLEYFIANLQPQLGMVYGELTTKKGKQYLIGAAPAYDEDNNDDDDVSHWTLVLRDMEEALGKSNGGSTTQELVARIKLSDEILGRVQRVNRLVTELPQMGNLSPSQSEALDQISQVNLEMDTIAKQLGKINDDDNHTDDQETDELVDKLLLIEKLQKGASERAPIKLAHIIEACIKQLLDEAQAKKLSIQQILPADLPDLQANKEELQQAIFELLDNAIKYSPVGAKIQILAQCKNGQVTLAIRDTGIGIWPKDIPFLFERFYRVRNPEKLRIPGAGLGLSVVKAVAQGHNGRVWVSSKIGQGSAFLMELPIAI